MPPSHPAVNLAKITPAPRTALPPISKNAPSTSNNTPNSTPKLHARAPCHQSCKNAPASSQTAPPTAHPNSTCASTPFAHPLAPSRQSRSSLSPHNQKKEPALLLAFGYRGKNAHKGCQVSKKKRTPEDPRLLTGADDTPEADLVGPVQAQQGSQRGFPALRLSFGGIWGVRVHFHKRGA